LKTPLSVLSNESQVNKGSFAELVESQVAVMRDQVELYLGRARKEARARAAGASTPVEPVIESLSRTLPRIYKDKKLVIEATIAPGLKFRGDQQDLEEMIGNLMDNACKWAASRVVLTASHMTVLVNGRQFLQVIVDDDGPGIPAEKRDLVFNRGQRLDERKPGSGLGLNIVHETVALYGGSINIHTSNLGGARLDLQLPAVPR
jgi:signal transduction histidine kinase